MNEQDRSDSRTVSVVDERFAELLWPGQDPIGKRWRFGRPDQDDPDEEDAPEDPYLEVVGVVNHVKTYGVQNDSRIQAYIPAAQSQLPFTTFIVQTTGDPAAIGPLLQSEVSRLDSKIPVADVRTMEQHLSRRVVPQQLAAALLTLFASLAVVLAVLGIYGVMAFSVAQREREVGIRMALGAGNRQVVELILSQGLRMTLPGTRGGRRPGVAVGSVCGQPTFRGRHPRPLDSQLDRNRAFRGRVGGFPGACLASAPAQSGRRPAGIGRADIAGRSGRTSPQPESDFRAA